MSEDLRLSFWVNDEMVNRFVQLTGDRSSLHTDADFARRSMYRAPVVHGVLPVLFVGALPLAGPGRSWRPAALSSRFLRPVFSGEQLELTATRADGAESEVEFRITDERGATITTGTLRTALGDVARAASDAEPRGALILDPPEESEHSLADISKGHTARLQFTLAPGALAELEAILAVGGAALPLACDPRPLAVASLTSTLVGMCLPGKHATFTDLSLAFPASLGHARHELTGTVSLVSRSTESIRTELSITAEGVEPSLVATGRLSALVNRPPLRMPGMDSISEAASDLGLQGRVALVTGSSRGIGETTVKLLAALGARVVVNHRSSPADAKRVEEEIRSHGGTALAVAADVSDETEVERMFETIERDLGPVEVLVNNAVGSFSPIPFDELRWQDIQQELDVSLKGAFLCTQAAAAHMEPSGGGVVINVSSIVTEDPPPAQIRYVVAKSALVGLTRSLAVELGPRGIRVNAVVPGLVETDLSKHVPKMVRDSVAKRAPLQRLATPLDVAKAVALLASSYSEFTSGTQFGVTGGSPPFL